jgi:hypothetical protein
MRKELILNFLDDSGLDKISYIDPIEKVLEEIGKDISSYAKGYFTYTVVVSSTNGPSVKDLSVSSASLYIVVPEMGYDYKMFDIQYNIDKSNVTLNFFTLLTDQVEPKIINTIDDWEVNLYNSIVDILNDNLADKIFRFIVDQIKMKREANLDD